MTLRTLGLALLLATPAWAQPTPQAVEDALAAPAEERADLLDHAARAARPVDRPWLQVYAGEAHRLDGRPDEARERYAEATTGRDAAAREAAELGLALLELARGTDTPPDVLQKVKVTRVPSSMAAEVLAWRARTADEATAPSLARQALEAARDPRQQARLEAQLSLLLDTDETDPLVAARQALARDDRDTARRLAARATTSDPEAAALLARAADGAPMVPGRVAVLLPLSGRFGTVGGQVRQAIELGWSRVEDAPEPVFVDAGETAESAVAALRTVAVEQGVVGVLGPLLSPQGEPVARAADALGVPTVLMAQSVEDVSALPWVFQGWVTPGQQVEALVAHVMADGERTRFAIVAPEDGYGGHAAEDFTREVAERGGEITRTTTYPPDATDFREVARAFAARVDDETPPTVDFDAVFLPDRARRATLVAPALAWEEIPLGTFQPHDDASVPLLGLSGWTSYDLISGGGAYFQKGLFTEVFVPPPDAGQTWYPDPAWPPFVEAFRAATERTPTAIEALASDAAHLAATAAASRPATREAFLEALLAATPTDTVTGLGPIDPDTHLLPHRIRVVMVRKDGLDPVGDEE